MALSRREILAGAFGAAAPVAPVTPVPPAPTFAVDWQGGTQTPDTVASLEAQIALVKGLAIKPEAMAFFAAQPITVDLSGTTATRATATGIIFGRRPVPPENPVLLHELLHRYHLEKLAQGYDNPQIIAFYDAAKAAGAYPVTEYMFRDRREFFAMCGSVTLYGKAGRQPLTRASVQTNLPDVYAWMVNEFG